MDLSNYGYRRKTIKIGDQTISGWTENISSNNNYIYSSFEVFIFYTKNHNPFLTMVIINSPIN